MYVCTCFKYCNVTVSTSSPGGGPGEDSGILLNGQAAAVEICALRRKIHSAKRQYPIAYLYPSTYVAKIHQDNNFLAFLMISFGMSMTITVHHMDKSVLFCLHMWFSQCLLGMEEGRGYAWKTQYHHHHAVVWDIRRSKSKRGEGEKMEKWKRSHFFARQ